MPAPKFASEIDPRTGERYLTVFRRGASVKNDPILNKGTCFTERERRDLGLTGLIPPAVSTPDEQLIRAYGNFLQIPDDPGRYTFLAGLQDRNETLFYQLVTNHLEEMLPIIYTPTVGKICETYSHIYRRPRGIYVSTADRGHIKAVLENAQRDDVRIIVATDNEAILGIGDQGVGGMGIAVGKVALYTAGAGVHPSLGLPMDIDVGTDNQALLADPLYLGVRHRRLRGDAYFSLMDELVDAIKAVFPRALVQWEDFSNEVAFQVLQRYRDTLPSFDDDMQGTAAVVEAGIRTGLARAGRSLTDERLVFYGAGASGAGCALQMRRALAAAGVTAAEIDRRVLCLDSKGLILKDRPGLSGHKVEIAGDPDIVRGWAVTGSRIGLADVVRAFAPTTLVGVSGQAASFTEDIVRTMHAAVARPIILTLSNPTSKVEARPEQLLAWTNGAAIIGTGSPFAPVLHDGVTYHIGQCNNAFVFPGIGLAASVVGAKSVPDAAFAAAAAAVHEATGTSNVPGTSIFPPIAELRAVSARVAVAVGKALVQAGVNRVSEDIDVDAAIHQAIWEPKYLPYRAG